MKGGSAAALFIPLPVRVDYCRLFATDAVVFTLLSPLSAKIVYPKTT